jgi:hypothetical protein
VSDGRTSAVSASTRTGCSTCRHGGTAGSTTSSRPRTRPCGAGRRGRPPRLAQAGPVRVVTAGRSASSVATGRCRRENSVRSTASPSAPVVTSRRDAPRARSVAPWR